MKEIAHTEDSYRPGQGEAEMEVSPEMVIQRLAVYRLGEYQSV